MQAAYPVFSEGVEATSMEVALPGPEGVGLYFQLGLQGNGHSPTLQTF